MGIAEIQAAFAASQPAAPNSNPFGAPPAPAPFAAQLAPAAPSPAFPAVATNPFTAHAAPAVAAALNAPAPAPFAFTPPAGFNPASAPPINPVGERQSLNTAAPVVEAPPVVVAPEPEAPKRRTRKPKAGPVATQDTPAELTAQAMGFDEGHPGGDVSALVDEAVRRDPDLTTEQIVQFLVDRGYTVRLERA
jgi:hypothetical protein